MDLDSLLIYGAYGYTGKRIAREAVSRGAKPVLAGRDADTLHSLASELGCRSRSFDLEDAGEVRDHLSGIDAVLNCAGPFEDTVDPLVDACIDRQTDYVDINAEVEVFERVARRSDEAAESDVTLLSGAGFDVVPTDCLAAHLHKRLPEATHLSLAVASDSLVSGGTVRTALRSLGDGGAIREDGDLRQASLGDRTRVVDFGWGRKTAVSVPLGDVSTAYRTTRIPNIVGYVAVPDVVRHAMRFGRPLGALLRADLLESALEAIVDRTYDGPSDRHREKASVTIWGEAWSENSGEAVESLLRTPDPYTVTIDAALACAERVIDGGAPKGYATPGGAFGPDFTLELEGVSRQDR